MDAAGKQEMATVVEHRELLAVRRQAAQLRRLHARARGWHTGQMSCYSGRESPGPGATGLSSRPPEACTWDTELPTADATAPGMLHARVNERLSIRRLVTMTMESRGIDGALVGTDPQQETEALK